MKKLMNLVVFAICALFVAGNVNAAQITVCSEGCSEETINVAIEKATSEDTIVLNENITEDVVIE